MKNFVAIIKFSSKSVHLHIFGSDFKSSSDYKIWICAALFNNTLWYTVDPVKIKLAPRHTPRHQDIQDITYPYSEKVPPIDQQEIHVWWIQQAAILENFIDSRCTVSI